MLFLNRGKTPRYSVGGSPNLYILIRSLVPDKRLENKFGEPCAKGYELIKLSFLVHSTMLINLEWTVFLKPCYFYYISYSLNFQQSKMLLN